MSVIYKWRIYCNTENTFVNGYGTSIPTVCYNNAGHSVNLNGRNVVSPPITQTITVAQQVQYTFYSPMLDFTYDGSSVVGIPYSISAVISGTSSPLDAQIVDITNSNNVIATLSTVATDTPSVFNFIINVGNINSNPCVWELQARSSTGSAPYITTLVITYYS